MAKESQIIRNIKKKIKTSGLFLALGFISLIGFMLNTYTLFSGKTFTTSFAYPSVILGIGLIFESKIRQVLSETRKRADEITILKIITFLVGATIFIGGLMTLPFLPFTLEGTLAGVVGFANLVAIFVIIYEIFWVE